MYAGHIGWTSSKVIIVTARIISLGSSLFGATTSGPKGTPLKFGRNRGGVALLGKPSISLKRGKIGPRLLLMTYRKSIRAFDRCQNQRPWMTLKSHYALCLKTRATFGAHHENVNEDPYYQRRRCSPMTLDSGYIRFMRWFSRFTYACAHYTGMVCTPYSLSKSHCVC